MNEEELREILGDIHLVFDYYYKYSFYYKAEPAKYFREETDEGTIYWRYKIETREGGNASDIYRYEVDSHSPVPLFPLERWKYVVVRRRQLWDDPWETVYEKKE